MSLQHLRPTHETEVLRRAGCPHPAVHRHRRKPLVLDGIATTCEWDSISARPRHRNGKCGRGGGVWAPRPTNGNGRTCKRPIRPQGVRRIREASSPVAVQKALPPHPVSRKVPRPVIARLALQAVAISCKQFEKAKRTRDADCRVASLLAMTRMGNSLYFAPTGKRGRLRAPPVADAASKKEWQRSKFEAAASAAHKFWAPQQEQPYP